jgi:iron complex transport system substrate-binding protein
MSAGPRIISLLPSATEMICALGLAEQLVGVSHECDYPPAARSKPKVVHPALPIETMSEREIDDAVSARLRLGLGLYELEVELIRDLRPDIIITQSLCEVCAPSQNEIAQLLMQLDHRPRIIFQTPHRISQVLDCLAALGDETETEVEAARIIANAKQRLRHIEEQAPNTGDRPRVFCMEWLDPVYCSGHWVPEMVRLAGGEDLLGREGQDSVRIEWERVREWAPEILMFMPCGYDLKKTLERAPCLAKLPGFADLPAAKNGRVFAVDANAYFARPGPRIVDGAELMAHLINPETFPWCGHSGAYSRLDTRKMLQPHLTEALSA